MKKLLVILAAIFLSLIVSCGGSPGVDNNGGGGGQTRELESIAITPANPSIPPTGTTQQFTATAVYSDGTTADVTSSVTWSSSNTGVATIAKTGLATSIIAGETTITATWGDFSDNTTLHVTLANPWTKKADFYSARHCAVGFSIESIGYIGTGIDDSLSMKNDFWEYDPSNDTWTQLANFEGRARYNAVGFSIGTKGYIGTGFDGSSHTQDFWEYDPATNTWTQKANFGGGTRERAVGFSIGGKGYIGTGFTGTTWTNDFWEYDPSVGLNGTWTQLSSFGGAARWDAVGFSIGSKGYIGTGNAERYGGAPYYKDFWEYNPADNTWTAKTDFAGTARHAAGGFSIGNKGYLGVGGTSTTANKDFWEYDPANNTWTPKVNFGGGERYLVVGFSIGSKGYMGTGGYNGVRKDFWEYDPSLDN